MSFHPEVILVPTDYSETAGHALTFAQRLALDFGATLYLVHVQVLLEGQEFDEALKTQIEALSRHVEDDARGRVEKIPDSFRVHGKVVRGLDVAESLLETGSEIGADLIVMGTNGRRGLRNLLLGSVAEEILRTAPIPVISVRKDANIDERSAGSILLPHDFSSCSTDAMEMARDWARMLNARITLLHAVEPVIYPEFYAVNIMPEDIVSSIEDKSWKALQELAEGVFSGLETEIKVVRDHGVEAILSEADPKHYDLIIMGNRGLSGFQHLLLGSVVEGVVRRAEIPVLSVRQKRENDPS